jgi:hypothetical protein
MFTEMSLKEFEDAIIEKDLFFCRPLRDPPQLFSTTRRDRRRISGPPREIFDRRIYVF